MIENMPRLIYHTDENLPLQSARIICLVFFLKLHVVSCHYIQNFASLTSKDER